MYVVRCFNMEIIYFVKVYSFYFDVVFENFMIIGLFSGIFVFCFLVQGSWFFFFLSRKLKYIYYFNSDLK